MQYPPDASSRLEVVPVPPPIRLRPVHKGDSQRCDTAPVNARKPSSNVTFGSQRALSRPNAEGALLVEGEYSQFNSDQTAENGLKRPFSWLLSDTDQWLAKELVPQPSRARAILPRPPLFKGWFSNALSNPVEESKRCCQSFCAFTRSFAY